MLCKRRQFLRIVIYRTKILLLSQNDICKYLTKIGMTNGKYIAGNVAMYFAPQFIYSSIKTIRVQNIPMSPDAKYTQLETA